MGQPFLGQPLGCVGDTALGLCFFVWGFDPSAILPFLAAPQVPLRLRLPAQPSPVVLGVAFGSCVFKSFIVINSI